MNICLCCYCCLLISLSISWSHCRKKKGLRKKEKLQTFDPYFDCPHKWSDLVPCLYSIFEWHTWINKGSWLPVLFFVCFILKEWLFFSHSTLVCYLKHFLVKVLLSVVGVMYSFCRKRVVRFEGTVCYSRFLNRAVMTFNVIMD